MKWSNLRGAILTGGLLMVLASPNLLAIAASEGRDAKAAAGNCTYYSDATRTVVVGRFGKDCCNNTIAWGKKTAFSVCGGCFVCTPPPR